MLICQEASLLSRVFTALDFVTRFGVHCIGRDCLLLD